MDLSLIITLGAIFLITLIGAYLRSIVRDRCLKSFVGFNVTLELASGKIVWGKMRLEPTGLELLYPDAIQDEKHIEASYVLYGPEYGDIQAIYRRLLEVDLAVKTSQMPGDLALETLLASLTATA